MPRAPMAPWFGCSQSSLPVAGSRATIELPLACTYITPSTTIGLNVTARSPTGYVQATSSFETVFLLIWSSAVNCDEWLPPAYCVHVVYGFGAGRACATRAKMAALGSTRVTTNVRIGLSP